MFSAEAEADRLMWRSLVGLDPGEFADGAAPPDDVLRARFEEIDGNADGTVSGSELLEVIQRGWGGKGSDEVARNMVAAADTDGDDLICFADFRRMLVGE